MLRVPSIPLDYLVPPRNCFAWSRWRRHFLPFRRGKNAVSRFLLHAQATNDVRLSSALCLPPTSLLFGGVMNQSSRATWDNYVLSTSLSIYCCVKQIVIYCSFSPRIDQDRVKSLTSCFANKSHACWSGLRTLKSGAIPKTDIAKCVNTNKPKKYIPPKRLTVRARH